jgi:hypothetical protein
MPREGFLYYAKEGPGPSLRTDLKEDKVSTQLEDHGTHWVVSTLTSEGNRHKLPRLRVAVEKGDPAALRAEIIKQADAARALFGLTQTKE